MIDFFNKFKIPTILGLGIIILGLVSGIFLVLREQTFLSKASPDKAAQDITLTNITQDSVVISWRTNTPASSFVTFGQKSPGEQTVLDDRDTSSPKPHFIHYVTLKNLLPQTTYQFKITSNKVSSEVKTFETAKQQTNKTGFTPIVGSVLASNTPLTEGIAYLSISGAIAQSAIIKTSGNFLIPLSDVRKEDLSDIYPLTEDTTAKITIVSDQGTASLSFKPRPNLPPLAPLRLGQNIDLTNIEETPSEPTIKDLHLYDLNTDNKINSADYALPASCFGKKPTAFLQGNTSCSKADLDQDGLINQTDLDLMTQKLKELGVEENY